MSGVVLTRRKAIEEHVRSGIKAGEGGIVYKSRRAPDPLKYVGCVASGRAPVWIRIEVGADEISEFWVLVRHFPAEILKSLKDW